MDDVVTKVYYSLLYLFL